MPRATKTKSTLPSNQAIKKKPALAKRNKLYSRPEKISEGTILTDLSKVQWCIGPSIGMGGFGEIYSACRLGEKNYDYVVKCEPHVNGPLFVEMHFYMRNAKLQDIQEFKRKKGLKTLGMPHMIGNGSTEIKGQKHRFIVMPRYGSDIAHYFVKNGRRLPEGTVYRLALQMLDVYEFIHSSGYVHADLKAANILLGYNKAGASQAYLVDYGLASHYTTKEFKPDPKKMHNGTIEYTSRDAHQGVATMRADLEILGYNLIEWLGVELPWVYDHILCTPAKVQQAKEEFMANTRISLQRVFSNVVPVAISDYMTYVAKMKYDEMPNYDKCRKFFENALKSIKVSNVGDLTFELKNKAALQNNNVIFTNNTKPKGKKSLDSVNSTLEEICASDDDDYDIISHPKASDKLQLSKKLKTTKNTSRKFEVPCGTVASNELSVKSQKIQLTPMKVKSSPVKNIYPFPKRETKLHSPIQKNMSSTVKCHQSPKVINKIPQAEQSPSRDHSRSLRSTSISAYTKTNSSPVLSLSRSSSSASRPGKTIINDNLTPNPHAAKTYEFNFELDVSVDANVIVNVKRKKKTHNTLVNTNNSGSRTSSRSAGGEDNGSGSPVTRIKMRKIATSESSDSPISISTNKKSKRVASKH